MTPPASSRPGRSLATRIRIWFLALGLVAIGLTGLLAFRVADRALEEAAYERLTAVRETKRRQIESYVRDVLRETSALSQDASTIDALLGFGAAGDPGSRDYRAVLALYDPGFDAYVATFDFEDLLLVDNSGHVVYAVRSAPGAAIQGSNLAAALEKAAGLGVGEAATVDYAGYPELDGPPAAFAAAPVFSGGERIGSLAVRISNRKIDEVMTGGGSWRREGLGETGETYLVGADRLMRSDSRFQLEQPESYFQRLAEQGYPAEVIARIRENRTAILTQEVRTEAVEAALAGRSGTDQVIDYRGVPVLSSYTPLELPGLDWVLLSEIDAAEVFAPVRELRASLVALALVVSGAFLVAGYFFSRRVTQPLIGLTGELERVERSGLDARLDLDAYEQTDDEAARLARTFGRLREKLRTTLVSRDRLDDLLASMLNAVFTVGEDDGRIVVRSANPAACRLLGYQESELVGRPASAILGSGSERPEWFVRLESARALPAIEKELVARNGRRIPVLFTAARLQGEGVVCVAQDITERKRMEESLETGRRELEALARRLISAQEEERARVARDLHDDVTQRLGVLAIVAGKLARREDLPEEARDALATLREEAIGLAHDTQSLSRSLHPSILEDLGLPAALRAECARWSERLEVPVSCAAEDPGEALDREARLALYRIGQESLNNVARHAHATEVDVELTMTNGFIRLTVEDDGCGFDQAEIQGRGGLGLAAMDERARLVGGRLDVRSTPGKGTRVTVEVPAKEAAR